MTGRATSLRRVRVVGNSGAGKTWFAARLAARLDVLHLELDAIFWDAGWTQRDPDQARALLAGVLAGPAREGWVADGNWNRRLDGALDDADAVVWLDYSRWVVMPRVVRRTVWRALTRRRLWHGNRERLSTLLRREPEENIVLWAWTAHDDYRRHYAEVTAAGAPVIRFGSPRAARRWLAAL